MATANTCPDGDCTTLGVDAVPLDDFDQMESGDGDLIIFDVNEEGAWVQSDSSLSRAAMR
ncbi:MAG: hypothetical protein ABEJ05_02435 [Haloglomus sp.]